MKKVTVPDNNITSLTIDELRQKWAESWGIEPHARIGRAMLEKSLECKKREVNGQGLKPEQRKRLDHLIAQYRRNPECFTKNQVSIKPGTKLIRNWKGERHTVTALDDGGFSHKGKKYTSLSEVASTIAESRWNGWAFFGLKYKKEKKA
jgi:hypothetical protein